jgi:ATP-dependent helicase/DNAse subunit B
MELFALGKVTQMARRLQEGDIKADPIMTDSGISCTYCDYRAMCKNPLPKNPRTVMKEDKEKLEAELEKIIAGQEKSQT